MTTICFYHRKMETNYEIITELSEHMKLRLEIVEDLMEKCDRKTYSKKLKKAAKKLGKSVRTVQRLLKRWEEEGISGLKSTERNDKGQHRISQEWQDFIVNTFRKGNEGSRKMSRKQVAVRVKIKAKDSGDKKYPNYRTVYRVLQPIIDAQKSKPKIRSVGWRGSSLSVKTRNGEYLNVEYSNHVWQCDHTKVDILLIDKFGDLVDRPWLTTVIDTYSRCIIGIRLGFDAPSSQVTALALRQAILPKNYSPDYGLNCEWGTYGKPEYFFTDGGKDFRSNHLRQIGVQLGFTCDLRNRPSEGGVVERPFGTFNTELWSMLPGYTGSNVQERPEEAEKDACLTLRELEKLLVRYIVDNYNPRIDARLGDQTRYQRWEAGLLSTPHVMSDRELDICLMKQTNRSIYRDGYIRFENLIYKGENLAGYAGEQVALRYDPSDITQVLVYRREEGKDVFLARAFAQDLEAETLSLEEIKATNKKIRDQGKSINNHSILEEVKERDLFVAKKTTKKEKRKQEQFEFNTEKVSKTTIETESEIEETIAYVEPESVEIMDYEDAMDEFGW